MHQRLPARQECGVIFENDREGERERERRGKKCLCVKERNEKKSKHCGLALEVETFRPRV